MASNVFKSIHLRSLIRFIESLYFQAARGFRRRAVIQALKLCESEELLLTDQGVLTTRAFLGLAIRCFVMGEILVRPCIL